LDKAGSPYAELKVSSITAVSKLTNQTVELLSSPAYIGSNFIPQNIESKKNYYYNKAVIYFNEIVTSEITVHLEQSDYSDVTIQHMYWKPYSNTGSLTPLNTQSRFDPASFNALGFQDVQFNYSDLVPSILRPNVSKDQSSLVTKKINVTYKESLKVERYVVTFKRLNSSATPSLQKYYYVNPPIAYQTLAKQQELAAVSDINLAFQYESLVSAETAKTYIQQKISNAEWSSSNFQDLTVETIKSDLSPKYSTASILLQRNFEIYPAKRFTIGLRSIDVNYSVYAQKAQLISKPFVFGYNVKNLTISADTAFNLQNGNSNISYIKYYISVDDGKKWIQISPIENPFNGVPEILSFNENVESFGQIKGVSYLNFPDVPVDTKSIRIKIEIEKPRYENTTPVIYSYQIAGRVEQL
jgi:hypothetical protein